MRNHRIITGDVVEGTVCLPGCNCLHCMRVGQQPAPVALKFQDQGLSLLLSSVGTAVHAPVSDTVPQMLLVACVVAFFAHRRLNLEQRCLP